MEVVLRPAPHLFSPAMRLPIPNLPGYTASPDGTIYGVKGKPLAVRNYGRYPRVKVNKRPMRVHRLIARTFLPLAGEPTDVRHLNDDKQDNRAVNLAWGDRSANYADALRNGRVSDEFLRRQR